MVTEEEEIQAPRPERVVIYARVSSQKQTPNRDRQVQRLLDYCAAKGYQMARSVKEIGSGRERPSAEIAGLTHRPKHHQGGHRAQGQSHPLWFPVFESALRITRQAL